MAQPPPLDAWHPLSVTEAHRRFAALGVLFWIAGGQAIDLFVGRQTRDHGDLDIAMLRADADALHELENEFAMYIPDDGQVLPWQGPLLDHQHQFWAHRRGDDAWSFEVLLEYHEGDRWLFRRNRQITLPLAGFGRTTPEGVPFVAPEVALLYKANRFNDRNVADFAVALPTLDGRERHWLRAAIAKAHGTSHRWHDALATPPSP